MNKLLFGPGLKLCGTSANAHLGSGTMGASYGMGKWGWGMVDMTGRR